MRRLDNAKMNSIASEKRNKGSRAWRTDASCRDDIAMPIADPRQDGCFKQRDKGCRLVYDVTSLLIFTQLYARQRLYIPAPIGEDLPDKFLPLEASHCNESLLDSFTNSQTFIMADSSFDSKEQPPLDENSGSDLTQATGTTSNRSFEGYIFGPTYDVDKLPPFDPNTDLLLRHRHPVNKELTGTPEEKLEILRKKWDEQQSGNLTVASQSFDQQSSGHPTAPIDVDSINNPDLTGQFPIMSSLNSQLTCATNRYIWQPERCLHHPRLMMPSTNRASPARAAPRLRLMSLVAVESPKGGKFSMHFFERKTGFGRVIIPGGSIKGDASTNRNRMPPSS
jgi:hypothetical protein